MNKSPHRVKRNLLFSLLLLLLGMFFFWVMMDFAMPTPALAHQRMVAQYGLDPGKILVSRPIRFREGGNDGAQQWVLSQSKDGYLVTILTRMGPLWTTHQSPELLIPSPEHPTVFCSPTFGIGAGEPDDEGLLRISTLEYLTIIITSNPVAARVELLQGNAKVGNSSPEDVMVWLEENGSSTNCAETSPGSGIWVGQQAIPADGMLATRIRVYDANGNLLEQFLPDFYLRFDGI